MSDELRNVDGRPEIFLRFPQPPGWACAMPDNHIPEGIGVCGMPVDFEPCSVHFPAEHERALSNTRPNSTRPITCPCEAFDRDLATDDCYCGHPYSQHSEDDDGLPCTNTAPYAGDQ